MMNMGESVGFWFSLPPPEMDRLCDRFLAFLMFDMRKSCEGLETEEGVDVLSILRARA